MPSCCRNMVKSLPDPKSAILGGGVVGVVVGVLIMVVGLGSGGGCGRGVVGVVNDKDTICC